MQFQTSPAFSLPKSTRKTFCEFNPYESTSPGPMYDTFGIALRHKSTSFSIGKSNRTTINHGIQKTPGPTDYNPEKKSNQKKFTIPKNKKTSNVNKDGNSLDPAYYEVKYDSMTKSIQNYSMGTNATRFQNGNINKPGPGDYQLLTVLQKQKLKSTFGTSPMRPDITSTIPGPHEYSKQSVFDQAIKKKLGKSISGRLKDSGLLTGDNLTAKAFGNYNINEQHKNILKRSASFTIGKGKRKVFESVKTPAPTDYITENYEPKKTFNAVIPTTQREYFTDSIHNPGPGAYEVQRKQSNKFTIPRSKSTNLIQPNPGVGRYNVTLLNQDKKGLIFKTSNRTNFVSQNIAGVGDYEISKKSTQQITIPKSERFLDKSAHKPGPGYYNIHSTIGKFNTYGNRIKKN